MVTEKSAENFVADIAFEREVYTEEIKVTLKSNSPCMFNCYSNPALFSQIKVNSFSNFCSI